jgi:hypothetical protein|tara:strand:+ start:9630 stop:9731 length:102 start_codon:yes stop_codon:yes gene_type:complete
MVSLQLEGFEYSILGAAVAAVIRREEALVERRL